MTELSLHAWSMAGCCGNSLVLKTKQAGRNKNRAGVHKPVTSTAASHLALTGYQALHSPGRYPSPHPQELLWISRVLFSLELSFTPFNTSPAPVTGTEREAKPETQVVAVGAGRGGSGNLQSYLTSWKSKLKTFLPVFSLPSSADFPDHSGRILSASAPFCAEERRGAHKGPSCRDRRLWWLPILLQICTES